MEDTPLEPESVYPYTSGTTQQDGVCKLRTSAGKLEVADVQIMDDEDALNDYLMTQGPVSVGVDANDAWQQYVGGVMTADQCNGQLDHAVQAVGINTLSAEPYIKVRNSWGAEWGEEGHIRLAYGTDTCGISQMASTVSVKKYDPFNKIQV